MNSRRCDFVRIFIHIDSRIQREILSCLKCSSLKKFIFIIHDRALHYTNTTFKSQKSENSHTFCFPYPCSCTMFGRLFCHRFCSQTAFQHHCKNLSSLPNTQRRRPTIRQLYPASCHPYDIANRIQHISSSAVSLETT